MSRLKFFGYLDKEEQRGAFGVCQYVQSGGDREAGIQATGSADIFNRVLKLILATSKASGSAEA